MPEQSKGYFKVQNNSVGPDGVINPGDRFLEGHEPTQEVMLNLLDSIPFFLDSDSSSTPSRQGVSFAATGAQSKSGVSPSNGHYSVSPENLPTIISKDQTFLEFSTSKLISLTISQSISERNEYLASLSDDFLNYLSNIISDIRNSVSEANGVSNINSQRITDLVEDLDQAILEFNESNVKIDNLEQGLGSANLMISGNTSEIEAAKVRIDDLELNTPSSTDSRFVSEYAFMSSNNAPSTDYMICDGSDISRTTYSDLFNIIGTSYGAGNGSTTFGLPNFSGRGVRGFDVSNLGDFGIGVSKGSDNVSIPDQSLPEHIHKVTGSTQGINLSENTGTDQTTVAMGNGTADAVLTINNNEVDSEVNDSLANNLNVANPYLTTFVFIKVK